MIYTFTNKQEIAGPLAALYVLRGSCCYASHITAKLPSSDVLKQLEHQDDYRCSVVPTRHENLDRPLYRISSFLDDYIFRPPSVGLLSIYEFTMRCYRRLRNNTVSQTNVFCSGHPLHESHCLVFRMRDAVPAVTGPRLPQLKPEMEKPERENHAKISKILFKPFREITDLRSGLACTCNDAYTEWKSSCSKFVLIIMRNMKDYYAGRDLDEETGVDHEHAQNSTDESTDGGHQSTMVTCPVISLIWKTMVSIKSS